MHACTDTHVHRCTGWYTGTHYTDAPLRLIHRHNAQLHCTATHYIAAQATNTQTTQLQHIKPRTGQHTAEASSQQDVQAAFTHQPNTANTFATDCIQCPQPVAHRSFIRGAQSLGHGTVPETSMGCLGVLVFVGNV